jgi:hypothetical protein
VASLEFAVAALSMLFFFSSSVPLFGSRSFFGRHGIGKRLRIGSAANIGTRPGEVVGAPARCNCGFAAIRSFETGIVR